ncbi:hypothetical protein Btru_068082 [Bulinus truncatus]|nr:hypothetical protein Btru_068082 [Bulinus truncatus]
MVTRDEPPKTLVTRDVPPDTLVTRDEPPETLLTREEPPETLKNSFQRDGCNPKHYTKSKFPIRKEGLTENRFVCFIHLGDYASVEGGSLKKHMRIHNDERPFKCQICSYASRNSSQLIVHLRTHTGDTPFHCTQCTAKFKINSDLKRHMRTHTGEKPFQCEFCDYKSSNKGNVKTHVRINHSKENEISCTFCQFVTSSKKRLREHIKIHNSKQLVSCDKCEYTCTSHNALRNHASIHNAIKPYRCNFCPFTSKQSGNLKKHVQNLHLDKLHSSTKQGKNTWSSKVGYSASSKRNPISKSVDRPDDGRYKSSSSSYRKSYVCSLCGSSFVREDSLRCHMKQHNSDNNEGLIKDTSANPPHRDNMKETVNISDNSSYGCQGIQHIVAAASKLNEENILSEVSKANFTSDKNIGQRIDINSFRNQKDSSTFHGVEPETINSQNLISGDPIQKSSLPWEHRSYTLNTDNKNARSAHDKRNVSTPVAQTNPKQSVRYHEANLNVPSGKKRKTAEASPAAAVNTEKSFHVVDTSQHLTRLPGVIQLASSLSDSVNPPMSGAASLEKFITTPKGEGCASLEPTYSIQLIPQSSLQHGTAADLFAQELIGHLTTHNLQQHLFQSGASKVQIVLSPGATVFEPSQACSQSKTSL